MCEGRFVCLVNDRAVVVDIFVVAVVVGVVVAGGDLKRRRGVRRRTTTSRCTVVCGCCCRNILRVGSFPSEGFSSKKLVFQSGPVMLQSADCINGWLVPAGDQNMNSFVSLEQLD